MDVSQRSPSPTAPIASTPGPRATALQRLYSEAIAHVIKTCSYSNFAACFPTPAKHVGGSLLQLHEQFTQKLSENAHREFGVIMEERNVVPSLNALDGLVEEARRKRDAAMKTGSDGTVEPPTPPHTLPPQALFQSHLAPSLSTFSESLASQQTETESANVALLDRVLEQRKQIASLVTGLENVVADLDNTVAALNNSSPDLETVKTEVKDVEEHMSMEV